MPLPFILLAKRRVHPKRWDSVEIWESTVVLSFPSFFICKGRIPNSETCALWFDTFSFPLVTPKFNEKKKLNEISFALRSRLFPFQPASLNSVRRIRFKCSHLSRKCCNCNVVYKWCWKHLRDASVNKKQSKAIAKKELKPPFETLILFLFWHYL